MANGCLKIKDITNAQNVQKLNLTPRKEMSQEDIKELKDDIKQILKLLNGNGKLGICAKVNILWAVSVWILIAIATLLVNAFKPFIHIG